MADKDIENDGTFPIRELSARTQVNTVTIRAWERRYGLLKPLRTAKGHRLYTENDVATIEKILALVARGVPLGKVKPLLSADVEEVPQTGEEETWQIVVDDLMSAITGFSVSKVEHIINDVFANYPAPICRERLIEPLFTQLALLDDHGAGLGFAENELLRYTSLRLSAKVATKKRAAVLMAGDQAPIWRLALTALELSDAEFSVYLFYRSLDVGAGLELARSFSGSDVVFYQDGLWNHKEQALVASALSTNDRLFLCGTAPCLSRLKIEGRVFADVKGCIGGLLKL